MRSVAHNRLSSEAMLGQRFGRLVVEAEGLTLSAVSTAGPTRQWQCRCDCGATVTVRQGNLRQGQTQSCGCWRKDRARADSTTHGMCKSREYWVWNGMIRRCTDPKDKRYHDYGGRGIRVCERWRTSFETFYADVGARPSSKHSLDRHPDQNGNYEPGNVRWATNREQCRNKRGNHLITAFGKTMTLIEWVEATGITRSALRGRLKRGWSIERALTEAVWIGGRSQ